MKVVSKLVEIVEPHHCEIMHYYDGELKTIDVDFPIEENNLHFIVFRDNNSVLFTQINSNPANSGYYFNACKDTKYPTIGDFTESTDFKNIIKRLIGTESMTVNCYVPGYSYEQYISGKENKQSSIVGKVICKDGSVK